MWKDPLEYLSLEDCSKLHEPEDQAFIEIGAEGGHIGRLYWHNQGRYMIEQFNADGTLHDRSSWEIPGNFAFVWSFNDYLNFFIS
jgi:hypothetical protein